MPAIRSMASPSGSRPTPRVRSSARRSSPAGSRVGSTSARTRTVSAPAPSTTSASKGRRADRSCSSSAGAAGARKAVRGSRCRTAPRRAPSRRPLPSGPGTRSTRAVLTGSQEPSSSAYASAARSTRKSVSGPGAGWRRAVSSGRVAMSSAGMPRGSSVGVGACTTGAVAGRTGAPSASTGTAQEIVQVGRSRSSTGRSASRAGSMGPVWRTVAQRRRLGPCPRDSPRESSMTVYRPSVLRRRVRVPSAGVSMTISCSPGRVSSSASSMPVRSRWTRSSAAASRSGRTTTVS